MWIRSRIRIQIRIDELDVVEMRSKFDFDFQLHPEQLHEPDSYETRALPSICLLWSANPTNTSRNPHIGWRDRFAVIVLAVCVNQLEQQ